MTGRGVHAFSVIPRREIQAKLMEAELSSDSGIGITSWLIKGLRIQELQFVHYPCIVYKEHNLLQNNSSCFYPKTGEEAFRGATGRHLRATREIEATNRHFP
jgi:ribosome biogenesis SPOUT family RNA methylase Rps3